jgi:hypothetical protein
MRWYFVIPPLYLLAIIIYNHYSEKRAQARFKKELIEYETNKRIRF